MNTDEWSRHACQLLKAELARSGVGYEELVSRLKAIGVHETYNGLAAKINRGTFSFAFFAQCMAALGIKTVRLGE
jgi:DNA (cytosine-5)-methyltransferase 1